MWSEEFKLLELPLRALGLTFEKDPRNAHDSGTIHRGATKQLTLEKNQPQAQLQILVVHKWQ